MFGIEVPTSMWFVWVIQLLVFAYVLWLATRFVQAAERIADRMDRRTG